jgi:large subunit ribosomal protein L1
MRNSKTYVARAALFDRQQRYTLEQAVGILKKMPALKFNETVDVSCKLGIDVKQSDQVVRGAISLPHGTGKKVRVVVIAQGPAADAARAAGADEVGYEELIAKIQGGWLDFDVLIATTEAMPKVRPLGRVLGPRGLMPNPKTGTVTDDPGKAVAESRAGRVEYRADRGGCAHAAIGKLSFDAVQLRENCATVLQAILRAKPASAKGVYLMSVTLSATMSPVSGWIPASF